jgi:hypothetical protein
MSDGEVEVEAPQGYPVLPKDVVSEIGSTKLFNKWSYEDVEIRDISLTYVDRLQIGLYNMELREWRSRMLTSEGEQRLYPNPTAGLHFPLRRTIRRQAFPQSAMPDH